MKENFANFFAYSQNYNQPGFDQQYFYRSGVTPIQQGLGSMSLQQPQVIDDKLNQQPIPTTNINISHV